MFTWKKRDQVKNLPYFPKISSRASCESFNVSGIPRMSGLYIWQDSDFKKPQGPDFPSEMNDKV